MKGEGAQPRRGSPAQEQQQQPTWSTKKESHVRLLMIRSSFSCFCSRSTCGAAHAAARARAGARGKPGQSRTVGRRRSIGRGASESRARACRRFDEVESAGASTRRGGALTSIMMSRRFSCSTLQHLLRHPSPQYPPHPTRPPFQPSRRRGQRGAQPAQPRPRPRPLLLPLRVSAALAPSEGGPVSLSLPAHGRVCTRCRR